MLIRCVAMRQARSLLTGIVAAALFCMMTLQLADVVARKLFATSVPGTVELIELLMLAVVFAGLPLASMKSEHVVFDMFDHWISASWRRVLAVLTNLFCAALLVGAAWLVIERAVRTAAFGDVSPHLRIGLAAFHHAIGLLLLLTAAAHLWLAYGGQPPANAEAGEAAT